MTKFRTNTSVRIAGTFGVATFKTKLKNNSSVQGRLPMNKSTSTLPKGSVSGKEADVCLAMKPLPAQRGIPPTNKLEA